MTLLILITFNHSKHTAGSTAPPLQSCDVRVLRGWPGSPAGRRGGRCVMLRASQGLGRGWNQVSFLTGLLVLKGHLRERDIKIFSFFSDFLKEKLE